MMSEKGEKVEDDDHRNTATNRHASEDVCGMVSVVRYPGDGGENGKRERGKHQKQFEC